MRVIVRTTTNLNYAGEIAECVNFQEEGIALNVNPHVKMLAYIGYY